MIPTVYVVTYPPDASGTATVRAICKTVPRLNKTFKTAEDMSELWLRAAESVLATYKVDPKIPPDQLFHMVPVRVLQGGAC